MRWVAMNRAYREIIGRSGQIGLPVHETLSDLRGQRLFEAIDRAATTGRPVRAREWRFDLEIPGRGRQTIYVDFVIQPEPAAEGEPPRLLGMVADVTERVLERRAAEERAEGAERRFEEARDIVTTLQTALLPASLPVLPRVQLGARYLVAAEDQSAGGDWFDTIVMPDGSVALVVGDVVGHGVEASAAMGQLRAVLHYELDRVGGDIEEALAGMERLSGLNPALRAATVCVAVLDPESGRLRYATCGHPPPLLVDEAGRTRFLSPTGAGPLGTGMAPSAREEELRPGEAVLLYSDGLIERPGSPLDEGAAVLAEVAADAATGTTAPAGPATTMADRISQLTVELITREGYADDVTALAARRTARPPGPFDAEVSDAGGLRRARGALGEWLEGLGVSEDDRFGLTTAAHEAVANALEHSTSTGPVRIHAELERTGVDECRVADQGRWRHASEEDPARGRGLFLIERLVDELRVERGGDGSGTLVVIRRRVRRPARLAPDVELGGPLDGERFELEVGEGPEGPHIEVSGALDAGSADDLVTATLRATRAGTRDASIDLSRLSLLASAGVRALYELRAQLAAQGHDLVLIAAPGTPAAMVLAIVGLSAAPDGQRAG